MEIMYWTFPHISGKWSVKAGKSDVLVSGAQEVIVYWDCGIPKLQEGAYEYRGTLWVDGPAVQQGSTKPTNPKDAIGTNKVGMSVLPMNVQMEVALALTEGALKYGKHNYRGCGVRSSVYYDAAFRHLGAWWEGEDIDHESGLSHITKAIAGLTVLRDCMMRGNVVDDRPPKCNEGWMEPLNERVPKLKLQYKDKTPKHYFQKE